MLGIKKLRARCDYLEEYLGIQRGYYWELDDKINRLLNYLGLYDRHIYDSKEITKKKERD